MEAADWASLSDHGFLERRVANADALTTADETTDEGFQILDQMEGDGPAKAQ